MKQGWLILCFAVSLVLGGAYDSQILALFSTTQSGDGTYYGYTSGGSCTLDPTPPSGLVDTTVAMNSPQYFGSAACGMCIQLTGTGTGAGADPIVGTRTVFVNNLCPECQTGDLDLGDTGDGRWDINWVAVPCPASGNLQYMAQGSHQWYIKLQVRNHRIPVADVQIKQGSSYVTLSRTSDNFFVSAGDVSYPLPSTIDIRVRAVDGQTVDDQVTLANIQSGLPFNSVTGVQFAVSASTPSRTKSPAGSAAASPSKTPSPSQSKSASGSPPAASASPTRTRSPSNSNAGSRSASPSKSAAAVSPSPTPTKSRVVASPTASRSRSSSASIAPSHSRIASPSATGTHSRGTTSSPSRTKSISVSSSHTRTPSVSGSRASASPTRSRSASHSKTRASPSPTPTKSRSKSRII